MRTIFYLLSILFFFSGCTPSPQKNLSKETLENLVELQKPENQQQEPSRVYIDSAYSALVDNQRVLVINGSFPDGCSHLESANHRIDDDNLYVNLKAWRNADQMCTQALTPFTFIYDNLGEDLSEYSKVIINDSTYEI